MVPKRAAPGSPNVVIVLMDDLGWADIGCYGSEIETPHIDALASRGIRFNHYTTHPICSPARAALLTGRNAHSVSTGWLVNNDPGYPGYSGRMPLDTPTIAETLRASGYATAMVGKWHNFPKRSGAQRYMANLPRLRPILRIPGRRDELLPTGAHPNEQQRRADRRISRRVLRDRRLDGQSARFHHRHPQSRRHPAIPSVRRQQRGTQPVAGETG